MITSILTKNKLTYFKKPSSHQTAVSTLTSGLVCVELVQLSLGLRNPALVVPLHRPEPHFSHQLKSVLGSAPSCSVAQFIHYRSTIGLNSTVNHANIIST